MPDPQPANDMTALVAVLSHQMGELKEAVATNLREIRTTLAEHGTDINQLKEFQIRAEEREQAEDRLRKALRDDRESRDQEDNTRVTLRMSRTQVALTVLTVLVMFTGVVIAAVQAFS